MLYFTSMDQNDSFKKLKEEAKTYYDSIGKVFCPAFNAHVHFTSDGFHHLRYDSKRRERTKPEQRNKLCHIKEAAQTMIKTSTIQEYREELEPTGLKDSSGFRKMEKVRYYGFWAVLKNNTRFKTIVRQEENGPYLFWSVMPYWTEKIINQKKVRILASRKIVDE